MDTASSISDTELLTRRNCELSILNAIAEALNRSLNLNPALEATLSKVAEVFDLHTGWIWWVDDKSGEITLARGAGGRLIAVGTTAVRAIETVTEASGLVHPGEGWTNLIVTPERGLRLVDGLLTGFHEPKSSHLAMLSALAGYDHLTGIYREALQSGYVWHEFGDLHLLLPEPQP